MKRKFLALLTIFASHASFAKSSHPPVHKIKSESEVVTGTLSVDEFMTRDLPLERCVTRVTFLSPVRNLGFVTVEHYANNEYPYLRIIAHGTQSREKVSDLISRVAGWWYTTQEEPSHIDGLGGLSTFIDLTYTDLSRNRRLDRERISVVYREHYRFHGARGITVTCHNTAQALVRHVSRSHAKMLESKKKSFASRR